MRDLSRRELIKLVGMAWVGSKVAPISTAEAFFGQPKEKLSPELDNIVSETLNLNPGTIDVFSGLYTLNPESILCSLASESSEGKKVTNLNLNHNGSIVIQSFNFDGENLTSRTNDKTLDGVPDQWSLFNYDGTQLSMLESYSLDLQPACQKTTGFKPWLTYNFTLKNGIFTADSPNTKHWLEFSQVSDNVYQRKNGNTELNFHLDKEGRIIEITEFNIRSGAHELYSKQEFNYTPEGVERRLIRDGEISMVLKYDNNLRVTEKTSFENGVPQHMYTWKRDNYGNAHWFKEKKVTNTLGELGTDNIATYFLNYDSIGNPQRIIIETDLKEQQVIGFEVKDGTLVRDKSKEVEKIDYRVL